MPAVPLKLKKQPPRLRRAVLEHEVRVEQDRLDLRQQRIVLVHVAPSRLHHRDLRVREVVDGLLQEVGGSE